MNDKKIYFTKIVFYLEDSIKEIFIDYIEEDSEFLSIDFSKIEKNYWFCKLILKSKNIKQKFLNKINDFILAGVNRVSLGVQGLNDTDLKYLGRVHNSLETFNTLDLMQKKIENISVDLIYALSCQNLEKWNHELQTFLKNTL